jgi:hypothetical protein
MVVQRAFSVASQILDGSRGLGQDDGLADGGATERVPRTRAPVVVPEPQEQTDPGVEQHVAHVQPPALPIRLILGIADQGCSASASNRQTWSALVSAITCACNLRASSTTSSGAIRSGTMPTMVVPAPTYQSMRSPLATNGKRRQVAHGGPQFRCPSPRSRPAPDGPWLTRWVSIQCRRDSPSMVASASPPPAPAGQRVAACAENPRVRMQQKRPRLGDMRGASRTAQHRRSCFRDKADIIDHSVRRLSQRQPFLSILARAYREMIPAIVNPWTRRRNPNGQA